MLGKGWFPAQIGGLDRYYRQLIEQLPEARGVVVGPAGDANRSVTAASDHAAPLVARAVAFSRAARREARPADVVDVHFALYAVLPLLSGALRRKPLLVHFHGPWADENVAGGDTSWWRLRARREIERAVYSRAALVVTLTGAFRRVLVERYGVSPWKTTVIGPGVDLGRFSVGDRSAARARFGLPPGAFVACCARRLEPRMGLEVVIEAWGRICAMDPNARLLIAGDGELRSALESEIARRQLADSVTLLGQISDDALVALYRASDVNVVPSVSFEGFGLVVLEAAACGTPSIVTRVGGLPEAIRGLGQDLTVPAGDVEALANRITSAKQELPSREHARRWAEARSWRTVAEVHRDLFRRLTPAFNAAPRNPRVVYVAETAQLSKPGLELLRLVQAGRDCQQHVVLGEDGPLVEELLQADISLEVLPTRRHTDRWSGGRLHASESGIRATLDALIYSLRLARCLRRLRPEVVHTTSSVPAISRFVVARLVGSSRARAPHQR